MSLTVAGGGQRFPATASISACEIYWPTPRKGHRVRGQSSFAHKKYQRQVRDTMAAHSTTPPLHATSSLHIVASIPSAPSHIESEATAKFSRAPGLQLARERCQSNQKNRRKATP